MILVQKLFEYLNSNCNYAVLRNFSGLPDNLKSRDIDIMISRIDFGKNKKQILNIILNENFKITTFFKSDRMFTLVCSSIKNGNIEIVQLDFFFQTSIYGLIINEASQILKTRVFNGKIYHVTKENEFLDKYLYLKFLNKPYPEKYGVLREDIKQSQALSGLINEIVGCSKLEEMERLDSFVFKRKVIFSSLRKRPLQQIQMFSLFLWYYLKNILSYKGFSIGFTGPDGSGKTTVINAIIEEFSKVYSAIELFHFRPTIAPNLGDAAHKVKLKSEVDKDYSNPHRGVKTGKINSFIRLTYYSLDYILGYFIKIRPMLHKRNVVVFDRYFTDICADGRRSKIFLNPKFIYWFGKVFIPKLDYNILLTADTEVILTRKQELTAKGIDCINENLNYLSHKEGYYLILNNGSPSEAVEKILNQIFEGQHSRNMKRINK